MAKAVAQSSIVFEVLDKYKDNYVDWSEAIEAYLKAQDLWDVVKSDQEPPKIEEDDAQFKAWEKKNAAALHAIKISCGRHFLSQIRGIREANKAWRTLQPKSIPPLPRRREYTINPQQGDVENVIDEYNKAYKSLAGAFSRGDISDAIKLCKENPALLKEHLDNYTPLLHQLIMLCKNSYENEVVEILELDHFPKEALEMTDSLGRTPLIAAASRGTIGIASCLVKMMPALLSQSSGDDSGLVPLAVAIDSLQNSMAEMLYSIKPSCVWTMEDGRYGATVITKCFEEWQFDFALLFIKDYPRLIFAKDVNGISPLSAAAREPNMSSTRRYNHKFPKFMSNFLRLCLPLNSMEFEIARIKLLIAMRNEIRDLNKTTGLLREAFFEAIEWENFNFLIMLINADKTILEEVNDTSKNIYMCAVEYRLAKVFSLIFWDKKDFSDLEQYISSWQDKRKNNLLHIAATRTPPDALGGFSKSAVLMLREVMWFAEVSELAPVNSNRKFNIDGKIPMELFRENHKDLIMEAKKEMKESADTWAIVGPLIITIMFAAAFQVPGGYNQETGFPIFLNKMFFKLYVVLVSISLLSATISVLKFLEIHSSDYQKKYFLSSLRTYNVITGTLFMSLATMLVAFCLGLFLTLHGDLAIFLPIAVIATFLVGHIAHTKFPLLLRVSLLTN